MLVTPIDHKPKRTHDLKRLRNIEANSRVSVLADHYAEDWSLLWWVRADGLAQILHGPDRTEPISWLLARYPQYVSHPPNGPVIRIDIHTWRYWTADPSS